ncbi:MAG: hypothetical protein M3126_04885 [Candidatus Eremiobacteraeota bacterium]|nr:hypothetical protein [Candidatus Eremiobacteraeota bacterium]
MTRLRWAAIVFTLGASLTNLAGRYKDHISIGWMPPRGMYSEGYNASVVLARHDTLVYATGLRYEIAFLLIGLALFFVPAKRGAGASRPHWIAPVLFLAGTVANVVHTNAALESRGWVPKRGVLSSGPAADEIRLAWRNHVAVSGIERELAIATVAGVALVLMRRKGLPGAS